MDKQRASLDKGEARNRTDIIIQDKRGDVQRDVANINAAVKDRANKIKANVGPKDIKALQARYRYEMDMADTPEEKAQWEKLYKEVSSQIVTEKSAAAVASPAAKAAADAEKLERLGVISPSRANKASEPKNISVEDMRKGL